MAAETHALWSGVLTFGLVSLPVSVVSALAARRRTVHLLHKSDHARLARRMLCPKDNKYVPAEHCLRGYEVAPDRYVVIRDSDIQAIEPQRSTNIEITDFVDATQIDPLYYDRPYYIVPQKGAEKPYQLLVETLAHLKKVGIAEFIMHAQEHLVAIASIDGALCLLRLHFQQSLVNADELTPHEEAADQDEKPIRAAVQKMTSDFNPRQFHDAYQEQLDLLIRQKKKKHQTVTVPQTEPEEEPAEAAEEGEDLIAALEESLARAKAKGHKS
jgi:DNA end-binding protein Ku